MFVKQNDITIKNTNNVNYKHFNVTPDKREVQRINTQLIGIQENNFIPKV